MMDRRTFVVGIAGSLVARPLVTQAQPAREVYRVGILSLGSASPRPGREWQSFIEQLRALNYVEGGNLILMYAGADARLDRLPDLAADLAKAKMNVIVTTGARETLGASSAAPSIPIVFTVMSDPIGQGVVTSLAHPGGNITGVTLVVPGLYQKYVELLREIVPSAVRFAAVSGPINSLPNQWQELETAGRALGLSIFFVRVAGPDEFDAALARAKRDGAAGIIVTPDPLTWIHRQRFVQLALKHRLPGIYWNRDYVEAGGLMTYSANRAELGRRAARYVDKILRGAKPGDLPVEQPTKFELVINLKTAKALGLTIPQSLLLRADEVIQ